MTSPKQKPKIQLTAQAFIDAWNSGYEGFCRGLCLTNHFKHISQVFENATPLSQHITSTLPLPLWGQHERYHAQNLT